MSDESLTEMAERLILNLITSGELVEGDKLSIRRLSKALHIGFMPVQDALKRLAAQGWVEIVPPRYPERGTYVTRTS